MEPGMSLRPRGVNVMLVFIQEDFFIEEWGKAKADYKYDIKIVSLNLKSSAPLGYEIANRGGIYPAADLFICGHGDDESIGTSDGSRALDADGIITAVNAAYWSKGWIGTHIILNACATKSLQQKLAASVGIKGTAFFQEMKKNGTLTTTSNPDLFQAVSEGISVYGASQATESFKGLTISSDYYTVYGKIQA